MSFKDQLHNLLEDAYNLKIHSIERLMGYEIATYKVNSHSGAFILKKFPKENRHHAKIVHENLVLNAIKGKVSCQVPEICRTGEGAEIFETSSDIYRLQTFLEGQFLAEEVPSNEILSDLGSVLA
ncbi:MAG: phosphotransferase, partial [Eudoraea sp.]|nr:phosphotransferase [Eudoraea sp.]